MVVSVGQSCIDGKRSLFLQYLRNRQVEAIDGSITNIPLENDCFDLVCAFDVIEHVADDRKAMEELLRVCRPGGTICITVPAFQSLWSHHDVINGHKRRYKKKQLQNLVKQQTAATVYISYFNSILFLPILGFRKLQAFMPGSRKGKDSDFSYFKKNKLINKILKAIFGMELFLLRSVKLPFGVSLMMFLRKSANPENGPHEKKANA
ncbi:MAG: class I SAM-dependent methyltransferase [Ferruginibacter sp.]